MTNNETIKKDGGWLYRGVFIAKGKGGFSFTVCGAYNPKGGNWHRLYPNTLTIMKEKVDGFLAQGASVQNQRITTI